MDPSKYSLNTVNTPELVCNMAVSYLGRSADLIHDLGAEAQLNEASRACLLHYDNTRKSFLELYTWSFAIKEAILEEYVPKPYESNTLNGSYIKPSDCLRIIAVGSKNCGHACACACNSIEDYGYQPIEGKIIPCHGKWIRYVYDNTKLESWSPMSIKAFALFLAREISGAITMDNAFTNATLINKAFKDTLGEAKKIDSYSRKTIIKQNHLRKNTYTYNNFFGSYYF